MSSPAADLTLAMPDVAQIMRVGSRLLVAILIGALIGIQRELTHKPAGLRTHMLVALGTAMVVVTAAEAGMASADLSRIIQGVITGIGFLGGGAILKLTAEHEIHGLTTAAGIWMTAAAAAAAGLGQLGDLPLRLLHLAALRHHRPQVRQDLAQFAQPGQVALDGVGLGE